MVVRERRERPGHVFGALLVVHGSRHGGGVDGDGFAEFGDFPVEHAYLLVHLEVLMIWIEFTRHGVDRALDEPDHDLHAVGNRGVDRVQAFAGVGVHQNPAPEEVGPALA